MPVLFSIRFSQNWQLKSVQVSRNLMVNLLFKYVTQAFDSGIFRRSTKMALGNWKSKSCPKYYCILDWRAKRLNDSRRQKFTSSSLSFSECSQLISRKLRTSPLLHPGARRWLLEWWCRNLEVGKVSHNSGFVLK